jgi:hypothetical protein
VPAPLQLYSHRYLGAGLAIASVVLLGCARKVLIVVPTDVHGHVVIQCGDLKEAGNLTLRVTSSARLENATCPVRQVDTVITRTNSSNPIQTSVIWETTGDGLVREMSFDVP